MASKLVGIKRRNFPLSVFYSDLKEDWSAPSYSLRKKRPIKLLPKHQVCLETISISPTRVLNTIRSRDFSDYKAPDEPHRQLYLPNKLRISKRSFVTLYSNSSIPRYDDSFTIKKKIRVNHRLVERMKNARFNTEETINYNLVPLNNKIKMLRDFSRDPLID